MRPHPILRRPTMTNDVLERRYGAARTRRWPVVAAASVLMVVALAWITWVAIDQDKSVAYQLNSYDVVSDNQMVVTIELNRDDGAAVECEIYAQSDDHAIVGERSEERRVGKECRSADAR